MRRKRRTTKMKSELGQSVDHFRRAASIAAQETSATVAPTISAARDRVQPAVSTARGAASSGWESAVATIAAATDSVRQAGKDTSKTSRRSAKAGKKKAKKLQKRTNKALGRQQSGRKGRLLGLALVGAAVGAGAAWFVRKRQAAQWDEYDPSPAEPVGADDAAFEPAPTTTIVTEVPSTGRTES
jgi:hypothetical protein